MDPSIYLLRKCLGYDFWGRLPPPEAFGSLGYEKAPRLATNWFKQPGSSHQFLQRIWIFKLDRNLLRHFLLWRICPFIEFVDLYRFMDDLYTSWKMPIFHSDVKLTRGYNLPHIFAAQCASQTASFPGSLCPQRSPKMPMDRTFHGVSRRSSGRTSDVAMRHPQSTRGFPIKIALKHGCFMRWWSHKFWPK